MDSERLRQIESLKRKLQALELEKSRLEDDLSNINAKYNDIMKMLSELSDSSYEEDMLARVYEQRRDAKRK